VVLEGYWQKEMMDLAEGDLEELRWGGVVVG